MECDSERGRERGRERRRGGGEGRVGDEGSGFPHPSPLHSICLYNLISFRFSVIYKCVGRMPEGS